MLNLLSNALKFTQHGFIKISVVIVQDYLEVSVKDTGIGISENNQKKLFKLFGFIKETEAFNKNGIGLGLMISNQLV